MDVPPQRCSDLEAKQRKTSMWKQPFFDLKWVLEVLCVTQVIQIIL